MACQAGLRVAALRPGKTPTKDDYIASLYLFHMGVEEPVDDDMRSCVTALVRKSKEQMQKVAGGLGVCGDGDKAALCTTIITKLKLKANEGTLPTPASPSMQSVASSLLDTCHVPLDDELQLAEDKEDTADSLVQTTQHREGHADASSDLSMPDAGSYHEQQAEAAHASVKNDFKPEGSGHKPTDEPTDEPDMQLPGQRRAGSRFHGGRLDAPHLPGVAQNATDSARVGPLTDDELVGRLVDFARFVTGLFPEMFENQGAEAQELRGRLDKVTKERDALAAERRMAADEVAEIRKRLDRLERLVDPRKR